MTLDVRVLTDPNEFVALAEPILSTSPAEHTIISTVTDDLRLRARHYPGSRWMVVRDGSTTLGLGMWTPPFPPYLGPMPAAAAVAVADVLADASDALDGVNGEVEAVRAAVTAYQRRHPSATVGHTTAMRLYALGRLVPPSVAGSPRTATADDRDLLLRWHHAFVDDAGLGGPGVEDGMRIRLERGALVLWEVDGRPVSMAGHTRAVAGVARVGPVYTTPEHRSRGYGSAVTAEVSRRAGSGATSVVLFTDLANPTSNGIYTAIGYRPVRDYLGVTFTP